MSNKQEIMEYNKEFVASKSYGPFVTDIRPRRKLAILTCMDTRLALLLPAALGLKKGDANIIRNAGAVIPDMFGTTMRSLLISVYLLGAEEIFVIGHKGCGVEGMDSSKFVDNMVAAGITRDEIDFVERCGISIEDWLKGFDHVCGSVRETVKRIRNHPLLPASVGVEGFVIDPLTGELEEV